MQEYSFGLDVTHLVQEAQKRQLMLYPLLIHVLGQAVRADRAAWLSAVTTEKPVILWAKLGADFADFFKTYVFASMADAASQTTPPSDTLYILSQPPQPADGRKVLYLHDFCLREQKAFLRVTVQAAYTQAELCALRQTAQELCHTFSDFSGI